MIKTTNPEHVRRIHNKSARRAYQRIHGIKLKPTQIVHHLDYNPSNNKPENLHLFNSNSEHITYHHFLRSLVFDALGIDKSRRAYKERNKDKIRVQSREYRSLTKDKAKEHREKNADAIRAYKKAYYQANKEKIHKKQQEYNLANKDQINAKRRETRRKRRCEDKTK